MVIVLFGVSGCGKSTIGKQLAEQLNWQFIDADDYHPEQNIEKMRQGLPLSDEDRVPWLTRLRNLIANNNQQGKHTVLACSALKQSYRELLGVDQKRIFSVLLEGSFELIQARLATRTHAFMNDNLLRSQFSSLEPAKNGLVVSIQLSREIICETIVNAIIKDRSTGC
ncbi:MAG: gluconokinase [bacterium]|nr:gluconokinase [Gammaproteobacteria bacterium]HIL96366.1 gluconokinase [Pseudomonadales bacterium]